MNDDAQLEANKGKEGKALPSPKAERRYFLAGVELRKAPEGLSSPGTLVGYASVFNQLSLDLGYFREQIAPGAFSDVLKTDDVRALFNHDENQLLGRSTPRTLRMEEDDEGLKFEIDLPNTQTGRDLAELIGRGDLTGCSFTFETDVDEWDMRGQIPIRTVRKVRKLWDVGPVTFPAYEQTTVAVRSYRAARAALEAPRPAAAAESTSNSLSLAKARLRATEAFLSDTV